MDALNTLRDIREWLVFLIDAGILYILVIEYKYDKAFNEHLKETRKTRRRKVFTFDTLTDGEGK